MGRVQANIYSGIDTAVLQDRKARFETDRATMASYDEDAAPSAPAARVGADLRMARERLGWSLPAIASYLRIRLSYLAALEEGRISDLPGTAYAVGFLRTYAAALGLDPAEISRRFRAEAAEANRKTELNFPAPVPDRGVPAGAVVLIGALLAIGAYIGWYHVSEHGHPQADTVQPVPERLAALSEAPTPPPAPAAAPDSTPEPEQATAPEAAEPPLPSVPPSSAAAAVPALVAPTPPPQATPPAPPPMLAAPPVEPSAHIVVHAKADAWIQVRDRAGQVLFNRVLRGGETWAVPDRPALLLTTGNAGGTELLVDGEATASLGNDGAVRRDLPLDADAIKSGRLAPSPRHP